MFIYTVVADIIKPMASADLSYDLYLRDITLNEHELAQTAIVTPTKIETINAWVQNGSAKFVVLPVLYRGTEYYSSTLFDHNVSETEFSFFETKAEELRRRLPRVVRQQVQRVTLERLSEINGQQINWDLIRSLVIGLEGDFFKNTHDLRRPTSIEPIAPLENK
jgi:hypothetical protein